METGLHIKIKVRHIKQKFVWLLETKIYIDLETKCLLCPKMTWDELNMVSASVRATHSLL